MESNKLIRENLKIINIGILNFYTALKKQNVQVVHVKWKPPLERNKEVDSILSKILK